MSGSFPTEPKASGVKITSFSPTLVSVTQSMKEQRRKRGGHRWLLEVDFPPMSRSDFAPIYAFAVAQEGQYETFTYYPPVVSTSQITTAGSGVVNGAHTAGDTTIVTDGWDASETCLKAGDFLKFANHSKVYMAVSDVTSDGSGNATITIQPALKADLLDNESITTGNVPFTVRFDSDAAEFDVGTELVYSYSMKLLEVI